MNQHTDYTPVALYARVSSDRQDVDLSISAQLRALRDYAAKNSYIVAREYVDEAESGRVADRPQFRRMLDEAAKPEAPFKEILIRASPARPSSAATRRMGFPGQEHDRRSLPAQVGGHPGRSGMV